MLTPDQVKPYLFHEEPLLRRMAAEYFCDTWCDDPELPTLILNSYQGFGVALSSCDLTPGICQAMTEETLLDALRLLDGVDNLTLNLRLDSMLQNTPVGLLAPHMPTILAIENVSDKTRRCLTRRVSLVRKPAASLWAELKDLCTRGGNVTDGNDFNSSYADDLVEALADRDTPSNQEICERLQKVDSNRFSWLNLCLIQLAGARKCRDAIPRLLDFLALPVDFPASEAIKALVRIGSLECLPLIQERFANAPWTFKNLAAGLLESIKCPESEDVILELLKVETDPVIRAFLCSSLCHLFSEKGFDVVRREVAKGANNSVVPLHEEFLSLAMVHGVEVPELEQGREAYAANCLEPEQYEGSNVPSMDMLLSLMDKSQFEELAEDELPRPPEISETPGLSNELPADRPSLSALDMPIRRTPVKVGRNDPCPCGSGKKYKKCCGKS